MLQKHNVCLGMRAFLTTSGYVKPQVFNYGSVCAAVCVQACLKQLSSSAPCGPLSKLWIFSEFQWPCHIPDSAGADWPSARSGESQNGRWSRTAAGCHACIMYF